MPSSLVEFGSKEFDLSTDLFSSLAGVLDLEAWTKEMERGSEAEVPVEESSVDPETS